MRLDTVIHFDNSPLLIVCEVVGEGKNQDEAIPVVRQSQHPRFGPGTRFDYGFMQVAIREGYSIVVMNEKVWKA